MLRNLYILSEGSWAIKSAEIFADLFFSLSLILLFSVFISLRPDIYGIPTLEIFLLLAGYFFYLYKQKTPVYLFSLLSQCLLFLLIVPISFLHPVTLFLGIIGACALQSFLSSKYSVRINLTFYLLLFTFLFDALLTSVEHPFHINSPDQFAFPFFPLVEAKSLGPLFSMPLVVGKDFDIVTFRSTFEYLSSYVLVSISWVAFRRPILLLFFVGWFLLYFCFGMIHSRLPLPWVFGFSSIAFLLHIAPGRNFYGSFYISLINFLILMPIAWLVGKFGGQPLFVLLIFFPLEAVLVRVFLGK